MEEKRSIRPNNDASLMHSMDRKNNSLFSMKYILILVVVGLLGIGTGYFVSGTGASSGITDSVGSLSSNAKKGETYGDGDPEIFTDEAEGVVRKGGIDGEGQYHLERPGGESQNVYMTSSVVDLSEFVGKKVKVWGKTFDGEKAGWLMDVGIVEVL